MLLLTFNFGVTLWRAILHISKLDLFQIFIVFRSIAYLVWSLPSDEVAFESTNLVFVFANQRGRHVLHTSVKVELFYDLVDLAAVSLSCFPILLHHFLLTDIFNRLHNSIQFFQPFLAFYDFCKRVIVFGSFHSLDFEPLRLLRL